MKKGIVINSKNRTIEMNKGFAKAASLFGSTEYQELQDARRDYPQFRVVTVSKKAAKPEYKGLTIEYMEKYIATHDDEEKSIMAQYMMLRGISADGQNMDANAVDFATIRDWFLQTFPAIVDFRTRRDDLLKQIAKRKKDEQEKAKTKKVA